MAAKNNEPESLYKWVKKVILSCDTKRQLQNAHNLIDLFKKRVESEVYAYNLHKIYFTRFCELI